MITENIQALITYRLEQADESLDAAQVLLDKVLVRSSVNRAYYAMFYAVLALLAKSKQETSKHSGAISLFDYEIESSLSLERLPKNFHVGCTTPLTFDNVLTIPLSTMRRERRRGKPWRMPYPLIPKSEPCLPSR